MRSTLRLQGQVRHRLIHGLRRAFSRTCLPFDVLVFYVVPHTYSTDLCNTSQAGLISSWHRRWLLLWTTSASCRRDLLIDRLWRRSLEKCACGWSSSASGLVHNTHDTGPAIRTHRCVVCRFSFLFGVRSLCAFEIVLNHSTCECSTFVC